MFKFMYVMNAADGEKFFVIEATLVTEDGPHMEEDGVNIFELSLEPVDPEADVHRKVWLEQFNDGRYYIAENLKSVDDFPRSFNEECHTYGIAIETVPAYIVNDTLVFSGTEKKEAGSGSPIEKLPEQASLKEGRWLDFDQWVPNEERDRRAILAELWDLVLVQIQCCGDTSEEVLEAKNLYDTVCASPSLEAVKDDIQEFFADCFWDVDGRIEEVYNSELVRLINLTVCPVYKEEK